MPSTSPLTASRFPVSGDAPALWTIIENAVRDIEDNTLPRFASTAARDTAYSAYVAAGGTLANGMECYTTDVNGGHWIRRGGAWALALYDGGWLNLSPNSPFTVSTNGAVYRLKDGICWFTFQFTRTTSWTGPLSMFTFPTGARPTRPMYFHAGNDLAAGGQTIGNVTVATSGTCTYSFNGAANDKIASAGSFPID